MLLSFSDLIMVQIYSHIYTSLSTIYPHTMHCTGCHIIQTFHIFTVNIWSEIRLPAPYFHVNHSSEESGIKLTNRFGNWGDKANSIKNALVTITIKLNFATFNLNPITSFIDLKSWSDFLASVYLWQQWICLHCEVEKWYSPLCRSLCFSISVKVNIQHCIVPNFN
jgi:hypothetical protein